MTSSWFFLSTLNYDARSTTHQIYKRIHFVHTYMLASAWFAAQKFPMPPTCERQINTAITWVLWGGGIFRLSLYNIQRRKLQGGRDLINVGAKKVEHYFTSVYTHKVLPSGTLTVDWFRKLNLETPERQPAPDPTDTN